MIVIVMGFLIGFFVFNFRVIGNILVMVENVVIKIGCKWEILVFWIVWNWVIFFFLLVKE